MNFKKFYKLIIESVEDEIISQKGEYHLSSGTNSMFFGSDIVYLNFSCPIIPNFACIY
jgi:hypothetical protein